MTENHAEVRVLGKTISSGLHAFWTQTPSFRGKERLFRFVETRLGNPLMTIRSHDGWMAVRREGEWIEKEIWNTGAYEPEVWSALQVYAAENEVLWDVGANVGSVAMQGLHDARVSEVHCFEPNPTVLHRLELNLGLNRGTSYVHRVALSDREGDVVFHLGPESNIASLSWEWGQENIRVKCSTIDDVVSSRQAPPPTLMKIDVEGVEEEVLKGAVTVLATRPPRAIVFEGHCDRAGSMLNATLAGALQGYGYTISHIERPSGVISEWRGQLLANFIAVHERARQS